MIVPIILFRHRCTTPKPPRCLPFPSHTTGILRHSSAAPCPGGSRRLFTKAIVRIPGSNFAAGLTTASLGVPQFDDVLAQHALYCEALKECGLSLTTLESDLRYPDSTFVEDTAVLTDRGAILTRPGAKSREGEVESIRPAIAQFFPSPLAILEPGTLDGGDICEASTQIGRA